jgi:hypothetical protein
MFAEKENTQGSNGTAPEVVAEPPTPNGGLKTPVIDCPARWNELVPERPVEWRPDLDARLLMGVRVQSEFALRFDELCRKCRDIIQNPESDAGWLTFRWLIRFDKGQMNWWKVLSGDLAWMAKRSAKKSGSRNLSMSEQAALFAKEKNGT